MNRKQQVVVVGAGIAGASAALVLARNNVTVQLLDREARPFAKVGDTLPPGGQQYLSKLGVWDQFRSARHLPSYGNVAIWGDDHPVQRNFIFEPHGHGWQLDRQEFEQSLRSAATARGAQLTTGVELVGLEEKGDATWQVTWAKDRKEITTSADFIIDASGKSSVAARMLGAKREVVDRLVCCYAHYDAAKADQDTRTWIEATPHGWWYTVLSPGRKRLIAFLSDGDLFDAKLAAEPNRFFDAFLETRHLKTKAALSRNRLLGQLGVVSAQSSRLSAFGGNRWLAAGDAAHSVDPLSSLGISQALRTGIQAAEAALASCTGNHDPSAAYVTQLETNWQNYLEQKQHFYALEKRWSSHAFWSRRSGPLAGEKPSSRTALVKGEMRIEE